MSTTKVSALSAKTSATGSEELLINDAGTSKKITIGNLPASTPADDSITYAKIQNVSTTDRILGRDTAGAGDVEEITPANLRTMINVADGSNNYVHPNHSGDVVSSADGATTIQTGAVDIAMLSATGSASGTTFLRGDNSWVVPTDTDTKWDGGTTGLTASTGRTSLGLDIGTDVQAYDADTAKTDTAQTFTATQTFAALTETKTDKSASFTPSLTGEGTLYSCTGTMSITMPTATAGKSFTIIHATATSITWVGTIKWNGGSEPTKGSGIDIYVFTSDGANWYGMQAGTGFA
jgi:hypothetical protein